MEALIKKAQILVDALPYIQKFAGKTVVIKYGGNAMINEERKNQVMEDITILKYIGLNPIVVHGGGPDISKALDEKGVKSKFVNGLRVTDELTVQVAQEVLIGKTNKEIVSLLNKNGGRAVGISGIDASFIECEKQKTVADGEEIDIGYVGKIKHVKRCILDLLCKDQWIPVIAPIGVDEEGRSYNINADTVASEVAAAVEAEKLILLTDVEGIKDEKGNIVYEAGIDRINEMLENGTINGGMIPKVKGCIDAIKRGVTGVHIIDGRIPHCLLLEIFTKTGIGSLIKSDKYLT
ncbi:MAG: acetylglutamate kinase [Candidatus Ornithomonoglobus sp.]